MKYTPETGFLYSSRIITDSVARNPVSLYFTWNMLYKLLEHKYLFQERGIIEVKGKGKMKTYLLIGKK
jgi:hypothetical protein